MPSICTCPDCHERVLVDSLADAGLRLRCPLCSATFEIAAVSAGAEPAPPWALPLLDERTAESESVDEPIGTSEPLASQEHEPAAGTIEVPADGFVESPAHSIAEIAAAADAGPSAGEGAYAEGWMSSLPNVESQPADEPAAPWNAMDEHAAALPPSSRARRREPQIGVLGHLIGVVLGGVVGIGLGYLVLLWMAGRQGDFLHIWDQMPRILLPSEHVEP